VKTSMDKHYAHQPMRALTTSELEQVSGGFVGLVGQVATAVGAAVGYAAGVIGADIVQNP
jgi:hypothetical protein